MQSQARIASTLSLVVAIVLAPRVGAADMNGQEDREDREERQEQLSANNTAFKGARLLERGKQAYVGDVSSPKQGQTANVYWSGDTLNMEVRDEKTGNRVAVKVEFFWFEAGEDRGSDFYVAIIRGNSSPNLGDSQCTHLGKGTWQLGVDKLAQFVEAKADVSGQGGAIRWDWSIPFQTYRWEPKQDVNISQHYALNAGAVADGSVAGSAGMKSNPTADGSSSPREPSDDPCKITNTGTGTREGGTNADEPNDTGGETDGRDIQAKGSLSGQAGGAVTHKVCTNYSITLYRWELQVSSGPTGVEWGLMPLDPKKATDNAYHEYYLVMQSEKKGQPMVIPEIRFGGNFECSRWSVLPDKEKELEAVAKNIRLTPPPVRDCGDGETKENGECVAECPDGEVSENGECVSKDSNGENEQKTCQKDGDCAGGSICEGGSCVQPKCMISDECGPEEVCEGGRCRRVECARDADCPRGRCSSAGECVESTQETEEDDEPSRSGRPDAGVRGDVSPDGGAGAVGGSGRGGCSSVARRASLPAPWGAGWLLAVLGGLCAASRRRRRRV